MQQDMRYELPWFFSDECSIDLNPYRRSVYDIPGIRIAEGIFQDSSKYPIRIMIWGGITRNYKSPLVLVNGMMNAQKYIDMLATYQIIETLDGI
jgi:hypothetical protein